MKNAPVIWLFRSARQNDPWLSALGSAGFTARCVPVLCTRYAEELPDPCPNREVEFSGEPSTHPSSDTSWPPDAVALTSRRALEAIQRNPGLLEEIHPDLRHVPWYAVGPATRDLVLEAGLPATDTAPGSGADLGRAIAARGYDSVLHLTGDPHRTELRDALVDGGVHVSTCILYRTVIRPANRIRTDLRTLPEPDWAVFFSPRGIRITAEITEIDWAGLKLAAIGPTTAGEFAEFGLQVDAVAEQPDPTSLIKVITSAEKLHSPRLSSTENTTPA